LHAFRSLDEAAQASGVATPVAERLVEAAKQKLLAARNRRVWPGRDEKILTAWNGLAIKGLAIAARTLQSEDLALAADKAIQFVHKNVWRDGRLLAVHKDGRARFAAYLDDHAFLLDALLESLQTRWNSEHLRFAVDIAEVLLEHFEDSESGGFYFTANDAEQLIHRPKSFADESVPSGNGVAAYALQRLGYLLGEPRLLAAAERTLRAAWTLLEKYPIGHASLLIALEEHLTPPQIVIVRGTDAETSAWQRELEKVYAPRRLVFAIPHDAGRLPPPLADKKAQAETIAYVCQGMTCSEPLKSIAALIAVSRE
jgi:uncharacterized protein YyaL (SSP411 family)